MKIHILLSLLCISLFSCQSNHHKVKSNSTIDSTLQVKATSILENKLSELNALSGQVIIMKVQTGHIKAMVELERKDSTDYQPCENFFQAHESALIQPISILAALETGEVKLSDKVDTGEGIYQVHDRELKDHNWHRGGYGEISIKQGLASSSNIAVYKTMKEAFGNDAQSYFNLLDKMSYGKPDSITGITNLKPAHFITPKDSSWSNTAFAWYCIGYNQTITPIQTLTFYNAIANRGRMVQPQLYKNSTMVINPQIANQANIDSLKQALEYVEFCGYFPANAPQYSIIVSIHKEELPASGGLMAGDVFRQIVNHMI